MTTVRLGKHEKMSNEEYHRLPGISRSHLVTFKQSPFKYYAKYLSENKRSKEATRDMILGSAFHTLVLEPHLFDEQYAIEPEAVKLKDVGKVEYERYKRECAELEGTTKTILKYEDYITLTQMLNAIEQHDEAFAMIKGIAEKPLVESSYFWQDEETGLLLKCRPDILFSSMIVDLKTTRQASTYQYQRDMCEGMYHVQAAMIREGVKQTTGIDIPHAFNICGEKTFPYEIGIKEFSAECMKRGYEEFRKLLKEMKQCIDTNKWPSYFIDVVDLPAWYVI